MLNLGKLPLHHIAIKGTNVPLLEQFYNRVLGLKVDDVQRHTSGTKRSVWLKSEKIIIMLEEIETNQQPLPQKSSVAEKPGLHLLAFEIARHEREQWKKRLDLHGVTIDAESEFSIYFRDPEGNALALTHYPDPIGEAA